ncbi:MAG: hypothetical protein RIG67_06845 [Rhodospirillales bacterium]
MRLFIRLFSGFLAAGLVVALALPAAPPVYAQVIIDKSKAPKQSGPVCGGAVGSRLQEPCGASYARYEGKAVADCQAGEVVDLGLWQCWACPKDFERSVGPAVDTDRACVRKAARHERREKAQFARAALLGGLCPPADAKFEKSFFDTIRGGECWACPKGYNTNVLPHVDAWDKCTRAAYEDFRRPTRLFNTFWPHDCKSGQFHDAWDGGACWQCPSGFVRNGNHVNGTNACSRLIAAHSTRATVRGIGKCEPGSIADPRNGGECWKCPTGYDRTIDPVDGPLACETTPELVFSRAKFMRAVSCPAGQHFDFIGVTGKEVDALITGGRAPKTARETDSGTCWSCPEGSKRTLAHVKDANACSGLPMQWYTAPYAEPGLFGIGGAAEVVLELARGGQAIEAVIEALAEESGAPLAQVRKEVWEEIRSDPQSSPVLASIAYSALMAGITAMVEQPTSQDLVTPAQRKLIAGFAKYMSERRTYIARDALAAYDAWAEADRLTRALAAKQPQHLGALIDTGLAPPDFYEIIHAGVFVGLATGAAASGLYTAAVTNSLVAKKIFPFAAGRMKTYERHLQNKLTEVAGNKVKEKLIKSGLDTMTKGFKRMASLVKAISSIGPQIIIMVAIEVVTQEIEKQIAIQDARPKLLAKVAQAQRPTNFAAMFDTPQGMDAMSGFWGLATSGTGPAPAAVAKELKAIAEVALGLRKETPQTTQNVPATTVVNLGGPGVTVLSQGAAPMQWEQIPGRARDIAAATDGTVWVIGDNKVPGGYGIYFRGQNARDWGSVAGGALRIAVAGVKPWLVNDAGMVFELAPSGTAWIDRPILTGGKITRAQDIGASAKGVWAIADPAKAGGDFAVYRWTGKQWVRDNSAWGTRITVDADGNPWLATASGQILAQVNGKWQPFSGTARDIAIVAFGAPAVVDAAGKVQIFDPATNNWVPTGRDGMAVALGGGKVWHLGLGTEVFRQK